jgi:urea carboxylase
MGAAELLRYRADFLQGKVELAVREETFRLRDYHAFLAAQHDSIAAFKARQQAAFEAERERWAALPEFVEESAARLADDDGPAVPPGARLVAAHVPGNVWQVVAAAGAHVAAGDVLVMLESMKMEIAIRRRSTERCSR